MVEPTREETHEPPEFTSPSKLSSITRSSVSSNSSKSSKVKFRVSFNEDAFLFAHDPASSISSLIDEVRIEDLIGCLMIALFNQTSP